MLAAPAVEASRMLGLGPGAILRHHLVPEIGPGLLTIAAFGAATTVTAVAALGFVSVGIRPPQAERGVMMTELLPYWREAPWLDPPAHRRARADRAHAAPERRRDAAPVTIAVSDTAVAVRDL